MLSMPVLFNPSLLPINLNPTGLDPHYPKAKLPVVWGSESDGRRGQTATRGG